MEAPTRRLLPALFFSASCACYVGFDTPDAKGDPDTFAPTGSEDSGENPGGTGTGSVDETEPLPSCIDGPDVEFSGLQRLTTTEFNNTVRDLLGIDGNPGELLPADGLVGTFESNESTDVTFQAIVAYQDLAEALAADAVSDLDGLLPCDPAVEGDACAEEFVTAFGRRAFRRPLDASEVQRFMDAFASVQPEGTFADGIAIVLEAILQSPSFLYRIELGDGPSDADVVQLTGFELATRLSYFLLKTTPDLDLLDAAERGDLDSDAGVLAQARRLIADGRAVETIHTFHRRWLGVDGAGYLTKDEGLFPELDDELRQGLARETELLAGYIMTEGDGRLETLLSASYTFANPALAALYGVEFGDAHTGPGDVVGEFRRVDLEPAARRGVLTQAATLATHAHAEQTSPALRGLLVRQQMLCEPMLEPPPGVDALFPEPDPALTLREQLEMLTSGPSCIGCHRTFDPVGFAFESYDPIGRYRTEFETGVPVDASGELHPGASGLSGGFDDAIGLVELLATADAVRGCVARQWLRFALGRGDGPKDECAVDNALEAFAASDYDLRELVLAIATSESFRLRRHQEEA